MNRAIFFDRDGTLIKDNGFLRSPEEVLFYNSTDIDLLQKLNRKFLFFIVSNQSGIGKGIITHNEVDSVNSYIVDYFANKGIKFASVMYCPHTSNDGCRCKKPKPGLVDAITHKYKISLPDSYVIGDHPSDMQLAMARNVEGYYLLTGHGKRHLREFRKLESRFQIKNTLNMALKSIFQKESCS